MAILKCKMCGGDIELADDKTFGTCEYCGCSMTFPKVEDEQMASMFNRGNHFRRIGDFDKALAVYEQIVSLNDKNAEAHWCCALSRFGIEYVEDPNTLEWLPTCHRVSFDSFLDDVDYLAALENSDGITRRQYQKDAMKISEVQRGILATSQNTEPFDVFICYKESDSNGQRTRDSLLAQEIYYQLTEQGRRVFFARITLEDVVGTQYEPYIFAALNSAKVMIVVGTKAEYLNAVWVKNEWSRFISMMKKDRTKLLLPCYKDMDPYDMPEQLSILQSYDMSKIGFIQDLTRGISKVLDVDKVKQNITETVVVSNATSNASALLKRGMLMLEDKEWDKADNFFEEVLNNDPECAEAYLGKMMTSLKVGIRENLKNLNRTFNNDSNYLKVMRFGSEELKQELQGYNDYIVERNNNEKYNEAVELMDASSFKKAIVIFEQLGNYRNSVEMIKKCEEKIIEINKENEIRKEIARKDEILTSAKSKMANNKIEDYELVIEELNDITGWKDADELKELCYKKIQEIKEKLEQERIEYEHQAKIRAKRNKKIAIVATIIAIIILVVMCVVFTIIVPNSKYNKALSLLESGDTIGAYDTFASLDGYKDSDEQMKSIYEDYKMAKVKVANVGDYVFFGSYEQDNDTTNGKEDIEWLVIDKEDNKVFVISKYGLDLYSAPYAIWEDNEMREWLNNDFVNNSFTKDQQELISTTKVSSHHRIEGTNIDPYYTDGYTEDKVFLLSIEEMDEYLDDNNRFIKPTDYALSKGVYQYKDGTCGWWLRSTNYWKYFIKPHYYTAYVTTDNSSSNKYSYVLAFVESSKGAIRPAMWIDISK